MKKNVGKVDRALRIVLGIVLITVPFVSGMALFTSTAATAIAIIAGAILLFTAITSFCPLFHLFGIRTCKL